MDIIVDNVHNSLLFTGWTRLTQLESSIQSDRGKEAFIGNFNIVDISSVSVEWINYFGTIDQDEGVSINFDENGTVYVVGRAATENYTIINPIFNDSRMSFLLAFNFSGNSFLYLCNS